MTNLRHSEDQLFEKCTQTFLPLIMLQYWDLVLASHETLFKITLYPDKDLPLSRRRRTHLIANLSGLNNRNAFPEPVVSVQRDHLISVKYILPRLDHAGEEWKFR